jgi:hypothetical protein
VCENPKRNRRSPHSAAPNFLWKSVALTNIMRLSLKKGAHAAPSSAAWQEIRVRSGRDDNSVVADIPYFSWKHGIPFSNRIVISTGVVMGLRPTQGDEKRLGPTTIFYGTVALSFVIPSEAEGSAVLRTFRGKCFSTERSGVERSAVSLGGPTHTQKRQNSLSLHAVAGFVPADEVGVLGRLAVAVDGYGGYGVVGGGLR